MDKYDKLAFAVGLLTCVTFRIVGTFSVGEMIAIVCSLFIGYRDIKKNQYAYKLLTLSFVWLLGLIISDLYNQSELTRALRGEFTVIFLILQMPFVYKLLNEKIERILYFLWGNGIASLASFYFLGSYESDFEYDVWKVYAWMPPVQFVGAYLYWRNKKRWAIIVTELFALWTLFHSSRNLFLSLTIANVVIIYIGIFSKFSVYDAIQLYKSKIMGICFALCIGAFVSSTIYEYAASNRILGEAAYKKYMVQKYSSAGLASGRVDFLIGLEAIKESPLIGYGSFAPDKTGFRKRYLLSHGYEGPSNRYKIEMPWHSAILGAWVFAGILGALFWFYVLFLVYKLFREGLFLQNRRLLGSILYVTIPYIWTILFSPFSERVVFLFFIYFVVLTISKPIYSYD